MDRYVSTLTSVKLASLKTPFLRTLGMVCLSLSAKMFEEYDDPLMRDMVHHVAPFHVTANELRDLQMQVVISLCFDLSTPTPVHFVYELTNQPLVKSLIALLTPSKMMPPMNTYTSCNSSQNATAPNLGRRASMPVISSENSNGHANNFPLSASSRGQTNRSGTIGRNPNFHGAYGSHVANSAMFPNCSGYQNHVNSHPSSQYNIGNSSCTSNASHMQQQRAPAVSEQWSGMLPPDVVKPLVAIAEAYLIRALPHVDCAMFPPSVLAVSALNIALDVRSLQINCRATPTQTNDGTPGGCMITCTKAMALNFHASSRSADVQTCTSFLLAVLPRECFFGMAQPRPVASSQSNAGPLPSPISPTSSQHIVSQGAYEENGSILKSNQGFYSVGNAEGHNANSTCPSNHLPPSKGTNASLEAKTNQIYVSSNPSRMQMSTMFKPTDAKYNSKCKDEIIPTPSPSPSDMEDTVESFSTATGSSSMHRKFISPMTSTASSRSYVM
jgi:hypothetical protein